MSILIICSTILVAVIWNDRTNLLSYKIIQTIDKKCGPNNTCTFSLKEITDFSWDRMVYYDAGSANEITRALRIEYPEVDDLSTGLIFVYHKKIVYREELPHDFENQSKLSFILGKRDRSPECFAYTPNDAIFKGVKERIDGEMYYSIDLLNTAKAN